MHSFFFQTKIIIIYEQKRLLVKSKQLTKDKLN